jgi:hypothetical protein
MALSNPVGVFGVHSISFFDIATGKPLADNYARVLGEASINLTPETVQLLGGSNPYNWSSEVATINSEINLTLREYPMGLAKTLLAGSLTTRAAEASGSVSGWASVVGTSITHVGTGVAPQLTAAAGDNLASGYYTLVATDTDEAKLYMSTDVDFSRGTAKTYVDNSLEIATLDFSTVGTKAVTGFGIEFTQAGSTALVVGDTATFEVRRPNAGSEMLKVGQSGASFTKVGIDMVAQSQSDGTQWFIRIYKALPAGMPISMTEKAYSEASITFNAEYDSEKDGIFELQRIDGE